MIRYRSTSVALASALVIWLLANVPGQIVQRPAIDGGGRGGPNFLLVQRCEHGWPFTYLERTAVFIPSTLTTPKAPPGSGVMRLSPWRLGEGVLRLQGWKLLGNFLIGAVLILAAGWLFQIWRQHRPRLLQFTMRDLLIATTLVSITGGYYVAFPAQRKREIAALELIDQQSLEFIRVHSVQWQPGGPTWLSDIVGGRFWEALQQPSAIAIQGNKAICVLDRFQTLQKVTIYGPVSDEGRAALGRLPQLTAIDVPVAGSWEMQTLTPLTHLRGLKLRDAKVRADSLSGMPALEVLDLSHASIEGNWASAVRELPKLHCLLIVGIDVDDAALAELAKCPTLRELHLASGQLTPAPVSALSQFASLDELVIEAEGNDPKEQANLQAALPQCQITWLPSSSVRD